MAFRRPPLRLLLALLYCGALLLVVLLLAWSVRNEPAPLVFTDAEIEGEGPSAALSLHGEGFSPGLKGVAARRIVNDKAVLAHLFDGEIVRTVDVKPGLVLASVYGKTLISITASADGLPTIAGSLELPAAISTVCIAGDLAVVAMLDHSGLAIVDISDPGTMALVARLPYSGSLLDLVAKDNTVYYADKQSGVGRIVLSGEVPTLEFLRKLESPMFMSVWGDRLAVATIRDGVSLFRIAADGRLEDAGNLVMPLKARGIAMGANHLAVSNDEGLLYLYDTDGWPRLGTPAVVRIPGKAYAVEWVTSPGVFAVTFKSGGVSLVKPGGSGPPEFGGLLRVPGFSLRIKVMGEALWCASALGLYQLAIPEIQVGTEQRVISDALFDQRFYRLHEWRGRVYGYLEHALSDFSGPDAGKGIIDGDLLAVADGTAVELFSVGPGEPHRVARIELESAVVDALFDRGRLYVLHKGALQVLAGASPRDLRATGLLPLPGVSKRLVRFDESRLLVATDGNGVLNVDVRDPRKPVRDTDLVALQHPAVTMKAADVLVDGRRVFVAQLTGGILVVDLDNPSRPRLLQVIDTPGRVQRLSLSDGLLLAVDNRAGIVIVDVRDRRQALPVGLWPMPMTVDEIGVSGHEVVLSDEVGGTIRLPLPDRLRGLELLGDTQARVPGFAGAGQYVYLYGDWGAARRSLPGAAQNL